MNKKILKEIGADPRGRALLEHYMNANGGQLKFDIETVAWTLVSLEIAQGLTDDKGEKRHHKWLYNKFVKLFASIE